MNWARLDALAGRATNRAMGEPVLITPKVLSQHKGAMADPDRSEQTVLARFSLAPTDERLAGVRKGTELQGMTQVSLAPAYLVIEAADYATLGYALRKDDQITFPETPARGAFSVDVVGFSDAGMLMAALVIQGDPA